MSGNRQSAVVFKKKDGTYGIDICNGAPVLPDDVEIIDVLHRKGGESIEDFYERATRYVQEECK